MNDKHVMTTVLPDGSRENVEVLLSFKFNDTGKEYVIYTKNESDEKGNITIYVSVVNRENDKAVLTTISDENEWAKVKDVLRELSKSE